MYTHTYIHVYSYIDLKYTHVVTIWLKFIILYVSIFIVITGTWKMKRNAYTNTHIQT